MTDTNLGTEPREPTSGSRRWWRPEWPRPRTWGALIAWRLGWATVITASVFAVVIVLVVRSRSAPYAGWGEGVDDALNTAGYALLGGFVPFSITWTFTTFRRGSRTVGLCGILLANLVGALATYVGFAGSYDSGSIGTFASAMIFVLGMTSYSIAFLAPSASVARPAGPGFSRTTRRLAVATSAGSLIATIVISVGFKFLYIGRDMVFGGRRWSPFALSAMPQYYVTTFLADLLCIGIPVAVVTFLLARATRTSSRGLRVLAWTVPSLATVFPAWWLAAWSSSPGLAFLAGATCAIAGAGILLSAAALGGFLTAAGAHRGGELDA